MGQGKRRDIHAHHGPQRGPQHRAFGITLQPAQGGAIDELGLAMGRRGLVHACPSKAGSKNTERGEVMVEGRQRVITAPYRVSLPPVERRKGRKACTFHTASASQALRRAAARSSSCSRSTRRCTLPVVVMGKASMNSISLGYS